MLLAVFDDNLEKPCPQMLDHQNVPNASSVRLVLMDAVGTVLYPRRPVAETYRSAGCQFGSHRTLEEIRARFSEALQRYSGRCVISSCGEHAPSWQPLLRANTSELREVQRWRRIVGHVFDDIPSKRVDPLFRMLWDYFAQPDHWSVPDELLDVRKALHQRGIRFGLASNFDRRLVGLCRQLDPLKNLPYLFCSSELGVSKPDPRFYRAIERRTGFRGPQILLVGDDRLHDVTAPRQFGWQTLLWTPGLTASQSEPNCLTRLADLLPEA